MSLLKTGTRPILIITAMAVFCMITGGYQPAYARERGTFIEKANEATLAALKLALTLAQELVPIPQPTPVPTPQPTPAPTPQPTPGPAAGAVPTCGQAVVDSNGNSYDNSELFVNWSGPGAPMGPCNNPGFGEEGQPRPLNAYSWTMASFGDHLYVGVYNRLNDAYSEIGDISEGAEVWRYKPGPTVNSGIWEQEIAAGFGNLTNLGVRIMTVYNDELFVGTHNLDQGAELWRRTLDTATSPGQWQALSVAGFGDKGNNSVRSMAVFNGKLYLGTANNASGARLYKFDAGTQVLSQVGKIGDSNTQANVLSELVVFGDHMWIFTWGGTAGLSAYRMDRQENIERASDMGANISNSGIMSSAILNGKIYVGTVNLFTGAELFVLENPMTPDPRDATWKRLGSNVFQPTEKYLWRMQAFAGQIFIGTWNPYDSTRPLQYDKIGGTLYRMDEDERFCQVIGDGRLIEEGFDQSENYGIRSMAEHHGRLYIGTAQPFKIEPGKDSSNAANREGTEVWEFDPLN
jgi:hypothetical protein